MSILRRESREDRFSNNMYTESMKIGNKSETGGNQKNKNKDVDVVSIDVINDYRHNKIKRPDEIRQMRSGN